MLRTRIGTVLLFASALLVPAGAAQAGGPAFFTVNTTADTADANTADETCDADTGTPGAQCTLRAALQEANVAPGTNQIRFSIGSGHQTIQPGPQLPAASEAVFIDGTTQPGFAGTPLIEINGDLMAANTDGITIAAGPSTVRALIVTGFNNVTAGRGSAGIVVSGGAGTVLRRNYVGFDTSEFGPLADRNWRGIHVEGATGTVVGGTAPAQRNVVSGNGPVGVSVEGTGTDDTVVIGNYLGTDPTGTFGVGGFQVGIMVQNGPHDTLIGGTAPGAGNLISGNTGITGGGVYLGGDVAGTVIQGNLIGTDRTGTADLGNGPPGVWITNGASDITVGGATAAARNVISGNDDHGINVGGGGAFGGSTDVVIQGNFIGTDVTGTQPLGNNFTGIALYDGGNTVGGEGAGEGNVIAHNGTPTTSDGITVLDEADAVGNTIRGNSIHSNAGLGIDLFPDGVTANDGGPADDADTGGNRLQNFPEITQVMPRPEGTFIQGLLDSTPDSNFAIDFFASNVADPSAHGEGGRFLGSIALSTPLDGATGFGVTLPSVVQAGEEITATATDTGTGDTSEFSAAVPVCTQEGTPGNDVLVGGPVPDVLCGMGGNDRLVGGDGDDALLGGPGNDRLRAGSGDNVVFGQAGRDTALYAGATTGVQANLAVGTASTGTSFDRLLGVEGVSGTPKADEIRGSRGKNTLTGLAGSDTVAGGRGNDRLRGGSGGDTLRGQAGNDAINGGPGNDTCIQGPGRGPLVACER
jgi:CSLREA domain-containing protein